MSSTNQNGEPNKQPEAFEELHDVELISYCLCKIKNDNTGMIGCDFCDEWYHLRCLTIKEKISPMVAETPNQNQHISAYTNLFSGGLPSRSEHRSSKLRSFVDFEATSKWAAGTSKDSKTAY